MEYCRKHFAVNDLFRELEGLVYKLDNLEVDLNYDFNLEKPKSVIAFVKGK